MDTLFQWTYTANHALAISLVYDQTSRYEKYFVFLTLAPGENNGQGGRTFNFKNATRFKIALYKLDSLSQAIQFYCRGQQNVIGQFSIINDSSKSSVSNSQEKKFLFLNYTPGDSEKAPMLSINVKTSNQAKGNAISIPICDALSIANMFKRIVDFGINKEMENYTPTFESSDSSSGGHNGGFNQFNHPIQSVHQQSSYRQNHNYPSDNYMGSESSMMNSNEVPF